MMKILILANNDIGLYKFRKELLQELTTKYEVYISLPYGEFIPELQKLGCKYIETSIDRRGTNPLSDLKLFSKYKKILMNIKPDAVLTYTIKPNVYGGLACRIAKIPYIANITGLGTSIESGGLIQKVALFLYKIGLRKASCVFFQNEPNRNIFLEKGIADGKTKVIPGSGVNIKQYCLEDYPDETNGLNFLFIGRVMKDKGIEELLEAARRIKVKYPATKFDIIGEIEEDYTVQLKELEQQGIITYHGLQKDVKSFIKKSHATILPSYHEGTANVLLESAASGRPVLASRVTGCLETFDEGVSGYGFEVRNVDSLVETVIKFIELPYEQKKAMGLAGRRKMESEFDRSIVINAYTEEIEIITNGYEEN